jgi:two-component system response regulator PilR (NtrC family)
MRMYHVPRPSVTPAGEGPALVISAKEDAPEYLEAALRDCELEGIWCHSLQDARSRLAAMPFRAVICNQEFVDGSFSAVIKEVKEMPEPAPVIVLFRRADWEEYLKALRAGAFDCISPAPAPLEAKRVLRCALEEGRRLRYSATHPH